MDFKPLKAGDEVRVIAPSQSRLSKRETEYKRGQQRWESVGYKVTYGKFVESAWRFGTASVENRLKDLHDAYADSGVKAILALNGGWSANELLPLMDWGLIRSNPKPFIGYSDITVLLNAIYAKTGLPGYLGPNLGTLGYMTSWQYTLNNLQSVLEQKLPLELSKSREWGLWKQRKRYKTKPWKVVQKGEAEGVLLGGNLGTFYLLQGTEFQPSFDKPFILAIEDDDEAGKYTAKEFSRRLESILQLPNVRTNMQGVLAGRFQPDSKVSQNDLTSILKAKQLGPIPVVVNLDFGHTIPMITLPIGGRVKISTINKLNVELLEY